MLKSLVLVCVCIGAATADGPHFRAPHHHLAPAPYAPAPYAPAPYAPAPPPYAPAPAPYAPAPKPYAPAPYLEPARPFNYEYGVNDAYSGASFSKSENQDDYGVVSGEYRVALPDGRTQVINNVLLCFSTFFGVSHLAAYLYFFFFNVIRLHSI